MAVRAPNQKDKYGCWKRRGSGGGLHREGLCVCLFELAQQLTNLFSDTNQQLHTTTTAMTLGKRCSNVLTCSTVLGLAVLGRSKPVMAWFLTSESLSTSLILK